MINLYDTVFAKILEPKETYSFHFMEKYGEVIGTVIEITPNMYLVQSKNPDDLPTWYFEEEVVKLCGQASQR